MSALSNCLRDVIGEVYQGKQAALADKTALPNSLISRYCSGSFRPNPEKLEQICKAHEPDLRARLAVAHLHDECPPSARMFVRIEPSSDAGLMLAETPDDIKSSLARLDRKTRAAIQFLGELALTNKDAQEALISTAKFLGANL